MEKLKGILPLPVMTHFDRELNMVCLRGFVINVLTSPLGDNIGQVLSAPMGRTSRSTYHTAAMSAGNPRAGSESLAFRNLKCRFGDHFQWPEPDSLRCWFSFTIACIPWRDKVLRLWRQQKICIIFYSFGTRSTSISILIVSLKCGDGTRLFNNSLT